MYVCVFHEDKSKEIKITSKPHSILCKININKCVKEVSYSS